MRKALFASIVLCVLFTAPGHAQAIEITPTYGYQFGAKLNYGSNYFKLKDGDMFGISLGYEVSPDYVIEATYLNTGSELRIRDIIASPIESRLADMNVDWFMVGGTRYFGDDMVKPFFGGQMGLSIFTPKDVDPDIAPNGLDSSTKFSFRFNGGVVLMFSENVGLRLQGHLLFPVQWGGFYVGGGTGGISTGVNTGTTIIMGGFSGGLVFRFGA